MRHALLVAILCLGCRPMNAETPHATAANPHLVDASSAYLRSAAHQPVQWHQWGEEAFEAAKTQDKPILLDIGAVWCHWCHVMDRESYENTAVAQLINEQFVPVKVDRDERPDVDRRYQEVVGAMTGSGGWPLTAFLTPEGQVFYGGTYFPPEGKFGRPGLTELLPRLAKLYQEQKAGVVQSAQQLHNQIAEYTVQRVHRGELSTELLTALRSALKAEFDDEDGGFSRGEGPKFPHTSAMELALASWWATEEQAFVAMVTKTLDAMAAGGIHDHVGGGFHRYAVDRHWHVPHFEKMAYDNAPLLENYVHAFQATNHPRYRDIAVGIIRFVTEVLSNQQEGGFYAFQDADVSLDDDGSYFTWTQTEIEHAVSRDEARLLIERYRVSDDPRELHATPDRKVLYLEPSDDITPELQQALAHLREARAKRKAPFVDTMLFASYNGMMISAYSAAFQAFGDERLLAFAQKSLDRFLQHGYHEGTHLAHALTDEGRDTGVTALLDDYVFLARATLDVYELTGEPRYLRVAEELMRLAHERLWDAEAGGFFDRPKEAQTLGLLDQPHKPIQDAPMAGANSVAARVLDRLFYLTNTPAYRTWAEATLRTFAGSVARYGTFAASYGLALAFHLDHPAQAVIVGRRSDPQAHVLWQAALTTFRPGKLVLWVDPTDGQSPLLPEPIRPLLEATPPKHWPQVFICAGTSCAPPTNDSQRVHELLTTFGRES